MLVFLDLGYTSVYLLWRGDRGDRSEEWGDGGKASETDFEADCDSVDTDVVDGEV